MVMQHPDPLEHVTYGGKTMDRKTAAALAILARRLGYDLTIVQGCYNPGGVSQSAGTHDKGGTVDLAPYDHRRKVHAARDLGFAAWYRPAIPGLWGAHVHMVMIGHQDLSDAARQQTVDYAAGLDGLAGKHRDPDPYRPKVEPFNYVDAWRDDMLRTRLTGITARRKALREKASALRARITYK